MDAGSIPAISTKINKLIYLNCIIIINSKVIIQKKFRKKFIVPRLRINQFIRAKKVRIIDEKGKQIGIMPIDQALKQAQIKNLDLVEIAPNANPPVCKIIDYKKYLYEKSKKQKKTKSSKIRTIRIRPLTSNHDLKTKARQIEKFLEKKDKVSIEIILRGREKLYTEKAKEKLQTLLSLIQKEYKIEQELKKKSNKLKIIIF